jgi:hypothetical protein
MTSRRIALLLGMAGVLAMSLTGTSQAAPATASPAVTVNVSAASIAPQACADGTPVTVISPHGHVGETICGTLINTITYTQNGTVVDQDRVVVGTDFLVYHDTANAWAVLQRGAVLSSKRPFSRMGVLRGANQATVRVFGTTGHYFCDTTTGPGAWSGWTTAGCPQT